MFGLSGQASLWSIEYNSAFHFETLVFRICSSSFSYSVFWEGIFFHVSVGSVRACLLMFRAERGKELGCPCSDVPPNLASAWDLHAQLSLFGLTFSRNKLAVVQDLTFSLKICLVACVKIKNRHTLPVGNESLKLQA